MLTAPPPSNAGNRPVASPGAFEIPTRILITAGPTHEPIDEVRFLGNRSSGRMGIAIAQAAAARGWQTTLLLGPTPLEPDHTKARVERFHSTEDLQSALDRHFPACDVLVMAAAVADFRPVAPMRGKVRRAEGLSLELESTPDLVASCAARARADQLVVAFALEPAEGLEDRAREKLVSKGVDLIVANPIETLDAGEVRGLVVSHEGVERPSTQGDPLDKGEFANWLLEIIAARVERKATGRPAG